jgi:DNA modification methylase
MKKEYKGRANINLYNCDNMEFMKDLPDNYYDLAIVDPPYGININVSMGRRKGDKKVIIINFRVTISQYHLQNILKNYLGFQLIK